MVATTSENTNQNEVQDAVNKIVSENLDISNIAESLKQQAKDWIEDGADDGDDYEKLVRLGLYGTAIGYGVSKVFRLLYLAIVPVALVGGFGYWAAQNNRIDVGGLKSDVKEVLEDQGVLGNIDSKRKELWDNVKDKKPTLRQIVVGIPSFLIGFLIVGQVV